MASKKLESAMKDLLVDSQEHAGRAAWNPSIVTLQADSKSVRIPSHLETQCIKARAKTQIGLFPQIHHVWLSIDDLLHIWDYTRPTSEPLTIPAQGIIRTVGLVKPKGKIFDGTITCIVTIATDERIHLAGLCTRTKEQQVGYQSPSPYSEFHVKYLQDYHTSSDQIPFDRTRSTPGGRIFLSSSQSPHVYELEYYKDRTLLRDKCRLICHTNGIWHTIKTATSIFAPCPLKLMEIEGPYLITCASDNQLTCYLLEKEGLSQFQKVCTIGSRDIENIAKTDVGCLQFRSAPITHIFPTLSTSGALHCMALNQAGERLHFMLNSKRPQGPGAIAKGGHGPPEDTKGGQHHYFWLSHVSQDAQPTQSSSGLLHPNLSSIDLTRSKDKMLSRPVERQPAFYGNGVWITGDGPIQVMVRSDRDGINRPNEMVSTLHLTGEVLVIGEDLSAGDEKDGYSSTKPNTSAVLCSRPGGGPLEGDIGLFGPRRTFVIVTSTGIQTARLVYPQRRVPQRAPPQTARECAACLAMLQKDDSVDRPPRWLWSNEPDDQRNNNNWIDGLFLFLAVLLRDAWGRSLIKYEQKIDKLRFDKTRVGTILINLHCVIKFIRQCPSIINAGEDEFARFGPVPPSADRRLIYTQHVTNKKAVQRQTTKMLQNGLMLMDRLIEILEVYRILWSDCGNDVLLNPLFHTPEGKNVLTLLRKVPLSEILNEWVGGLQSETATTVEVMNPPPNSIVRLQPLATLVTAYIRYATQEKVNELEKCAPTIFRFSNERCNINPQGSTPFPNGWCPAQSSSSAPRETATEYYTRFVRNVDVTLQNDTELHNIAKKINKIVKENIHRALDLCLEKVQQLCTHPDTDHHRIYALLGTLLETVANPLNKIFLDHTLQKLRTLYQGYDDRQLPIAVHVFFQFLLQHPEGKAAHKLLIDVYGPEVKEWCSTYLDHAALTSLVAMQCHANFLIKLEQYDRAGRILTRLAGITGDDAVGLENISLEDRIMYLQQAHGVTYKHCEQVNRNVYADVLIKIEGHVRLAEFCQMPLLRELQWLAIEKNCRWMGKSSRDTIKQILESEEDIAHRLITDMKFLIEVAIQCHLPHIVLRMMIICHGLTAQSGMDPQDQCDDAWIQIFFPADGSPFMIPTTTAENRIPFPFFAIHPEPYFSSDPIASTAAVTQIQDLPRLIHNFVLELARTSDPARSFVLNYQKVATYLEFANCVMRRHDPEIDSDRSWVMNLFRENPFNCNQSMLLGIYSRLLYTVENWYPNIVKRIKTLSESHNLDEITLDEVVVHLCEQTLVIAEDFVEDAKRNKNNPQASPSYNNSMVEIGQILNLLNTHLYTFDDIPRIQNALKVVQRLFKDVPDHIRVEYANVAVI